MKNIEIFNNFTNLKDNIDSINSKIKYVEESINDERNEIVSNSNNIINLEKDVELFKIYNSTIDENKTQIDSLRESLSSYDEKLHLLHEKIAEVKEETITISNNLIDKIVLCNKNTSENIEVLRKDVIKYKIQNEEFMTTEIKKFSNQYNEIIRNEIYSQAKNSSFVENNNRFLFDKINKIENIIEKQKDEKHIHHLPPKKSKTTLKKYKKIPYYIIMFKIKIKKKSVFFR